MAITAKEIRIDDFEFTYELLDFHFHIPPGDHGQGFLCLRLQEWLNISLVFPYGKRLTVSHINSETDILFCGLIQDARLEHKDQYYELFIRLSTASIILDREKKIRSFQNIDMTYMQVLSDMLSETEHAGHIMDGGCA